MNENKVSKLERLKSRKEISRLFTSGKFLFAQNLKVIFCTTENNKIPIQFGISVPKRLVKHAVDRNLLKRRIRSAYQNQKSEFWQLLQNKNISINMMLIYTKKEIKPYEEISKDIENIILKFEQIQP